MEESFLKYEMDIIALFENPFKWLFMNDFLLF